MKRIWVVVLVLAAMTGCNRPSKMEEYRREKHERDSAAFVAQEKSLAYYQAQLDSLMPVSDSLLALFKYEKNEKYQDHGFYVVKNEKLKVYGSGLRVMVRDDGKELLIYRNGERQMANGEWTKASGGKLRTNEQVLLERAEHLQVVILDIKELEKRIQRTSLEVQKYQRRLENSLEAQ